MVAFGGSYDYQGEGGGEVRNSLHISYSTLSPEEHSSFHALLHSPLHPPISLNPKS